MKGYPNSGGYSPFTLHPSRIHPKTYQSPELPPPPELPPSKVLLQLPRSTNFAFSTPIQEGAQWSMKEAETYIWNELLMKKLS